MGRLLRSRFGSALDDSCFDSRFLKFIKLSVGWFGGKGRGNQGVCNGGGAELGRAALCTHSTAVPCSTPEQCAGLCCALLGVLSLSCVWELPCCSWFHTALCRAPYNIKINQDSLLWWLSSS